MISYGTIMYMILVVLNYPLINLNFNQLKKEIKKTYSQIEGEENSWYLESLHDTELTFLQFYNIFVISQKNKCEDTINHHFLYAIWHLNLLFSNRCNNSDTYRNQLRITTHC